MEVHPAFIKTFIQRYENDFEVDEIIAKVGELAENKEFQECALLASEFMVNEMAEESFGIVDQMFEDLSLDALIKFCSTSDLKRKIIVLLSTIKYHKVACKVLDSDKSLDPLEFPDLITILKSQTVRNLVKGKDLQCAADGLTRDLEALGIFINSLEFHYSTKRDNYRGGIAVDLLRSVPQVEEYVLPSVKQELANVAPIPVPIGQMGEFGPRIRGVTKMAFSMDNIRVIENIQQVQEVSFDKIASISVIANQQLHCYDVQNPSLIVVACQEFIYIFDFIKMPECAMRDNVLRGLLQSSSIEKIGNSCLSALKKTLQIKYQMQFKAYPGINRFLDISKVTDEDLSVLAEKYLSLKICRSEQWSNWDRRPLSYSQLYYAASEASVTLYLAEVIKALESEQKRKPMRKAILSK